MFANTSGYINEFNGYEGQIEWQKCNDSLSISGNMSCNFAKKRSFSVNLYRENGQAAVVGTLSTQRTVAPLSRNIRANNDDVLTSEEVRENLSVQPAIASSSHVQANNEYLVTQTESDDDSVDEFNSFNFWKIPESNAEENEQLYAQVLANTEEEQPFLHEEVNYHNLN